MKRIKDNIKFILGNLLVILLVISVSELVLTSLLNNSDKIPTKWLEWFQEYYEFRDRRIVQFSKDLAHYDANLFYKLNPGKHHFSNREFDTEFSVNSLGLRDDEESIDRPSIICIGYSYTMGWGANDDDNIPALIEQKTGIKTLNAGISSYGTARECTLFGQLDTSELKCVVLQYSPNDHWENKEFRANGNSYSPSAKTKYDTIVNVYESATAYFPFKHTAALTRRLLRPLKSLVPAQNGQSGIESYGLADEQVLDFINVLNSTKFPDSIPIMVYQVDFEETEVQFISQLRTFLSKHQSGLHNPVYVIDLQKLLSQRHYFPLDKHLNRSGNAIVSDTLSKFLQQRLEIDS